MLTPHIWKLTWLSCKLHKNTIFFLFYKFGSPYSTYTKAHLTFLLSRVPLEHYNFLGSFIQIAGESFPLSDQFADLSLQGHLALVHDVYLKMTKENVVSKLLRASNREGGRWVGCKKEKITTTGDTEHTYYTGKGTGQQKAHKVCQETGPNKRKKSGS